MPRRLVFAFSFILSGPLAAQADQYTREVQSIAERLDVRLAMDAIDRLEPRTLQDHIMLTEIPAPPFKEEVRARRYAELLREAGVDSVWIDEVGNVLALRRGTPGDRTVAIDAHLDTVFPEGTDVSVTTRGDTLAAPGIADDTRGLAVVLTVLRAMNEAQIRTAANVLVVGSVGEEGIGDLRGVKHIFRDGGPRIDSWIAVDGIALERNTHRGLGSHRYRITFRGPGGHSWGAFGLGNPHHALGQAIQRFVALADPFTAEGARTSYNVDRIGGGTSVNSIPFESWMEVDMRSVSPERLIQIDELLQRAVRQALAEANEIRRDGAPLTVDIDMIGDRPSGEIAEDAPIVQRSMAATRYVGAEPELGIGSTNSNIPISLGIPAVTIGGGGASSGAHSLDEWFVNAEGALGIKKVLLLLAAQAGFSDPIN